MLPAPTTPLYNAFLNKLIIEGEQKIVESFADLGVFNKLKWKQPHGSAEQPADKRDDPYELGLRTEHLLAVTNKQRSNHIERLASRNKCLEILSPVSC